jgi:hypothetical protein
VHWPEKDSPARSPALTLTRRLEEACGGHTPQATERALLGVVADNTSLSVTPPRPLLSLSPGARSEANSSLGSSMAADDGGGILPIMIFLHHHLHRLMNCRLHRLMNPLQFTHVFKKVYAIQNNILMVLSDMVCSLP